MKNTETMPEAGASDKSPALLDKRGLGAMIQLSPRSVSNLMEKGCPHMRIGERRVRFEPEAVLKWLRETYSCKRVGKLNGNGSRQ
jgi:phage terminase Nu1 subunit (DNA packaging protein)